MPRASASARTGASCWLLFLFLTLMALHAAEAPTLDDRAFPRPANAAAATNPGSRPLLSLPRPLPGLGWRLEWSATPGTLYRLDTAPRMEGVPAWSPLVTLQATGAVMRYDDAAPALQRFYRVSTETSGPGEPRMVGVTPLAGTFGATNAGIWVATVTLRAGLVDLPATGAAPLSVDPTLRRLTGNGSVSLPGLGPVVSGAFVLDLATGKLSGPPAADLAAHPELELSLRTVEIDVLNGTVTGPGTAVFRLTSTESERAPASVRASAGAEEPGPTLEGRFSWDPASASWRFVGRAAFRGVSLDGEGSVNPETATCDLTGVLFVPGTETTPFKLSEAQFAVERPAGDAPRVRLGGRPDLPALTALGARLDGLLNRDGSLSLTGTAAGRLDALRFTALHLTLQRGAGTGNAVLRFSGPLELPRVGGSALAGRLLPDGSLTNVVATEPLRFGNLEIRPRAGAPVLSLRQSTSTRHTFAVRGEFHTPAENGTQPVEVSGPLVLLGNGPQLEVESLQLTNVVPMASWPLPAALRLTNASVLLTLTNREFEARLRGGILLTRGANAVTTLALDTALGVRVDDPTDVDFDAAIRAQNLPMLGKVWWRDAVFRVQTGTKPPRAALGVSQGSAGFFPYPGREGVVSPGRSDFRLFVENVGAGFEFVGDTFSAHLTNGTLRLPTLFTNQPPGLCPDQAVTSLGLGTNTAITLEFDPSPAPNLTVRARGSFEFRNLTFVPGGQGFGVELCRASLAFNPGGLPYFTNVQGTLLLPLPPGQTNRVELQNAAWEIDGLPSGTVALMSPLTLYQGHGMRFTLLPRGNTNCGSGTALTVLPGEPFEPRALQLSGGIEVTLPADLVTDVEGDTVRGIACGSLLLDPQDPLRPQLLVSNLAVGGTFHLGGASGLLVTNGLLSFQNLHNAFSLSAQTPVVIRVGGTLSVASLPSFTLNDARFIFFDAERPPRFDIAGLGFDEREFQIAKKVPARLTKGSFTFHQRDLPLPALLHPTNLNLTFSAKIALPTTSDPMFESSADDVKIDVNEKGAPIFKGLNGISMALRALKIPPIEDIGGMLTAWGLGGLAGDEPGSNPARHAAPGPSSELDLDDLFLAGRVVGSYQGYKVNLVMALRPSGMVGVCVDANLGAVGIPLDGYALGGILLTGASGGIAFGNGFVDPCEFTQYLDANGKPKPGVTELPTITLSWEDLKKKLAKAQAKAEGFAEFIYDHTPSTAPAAVPAPAAPRASLAGPLAPASLLPHARSTNEFGIPCPGDCPPPTMNLFCQPHPDQERYPRRVIARYSSVDAATLASLGFTREAVRARFAQGGDIAGLLGGDLSRHLAMVVSSQTTRPDPALLGPQAAALDAWIEQALAELRSTVVTLVREQLLGVTQADRAYEALTDLAYGGVPCLDLTLTMSGTLTHSVVSSFLSGTVGATVTTAGSAGVSGRVNVLGVPIGRAKGFLSATDEGGSLNPSLCGQIDVAMGPLELGVMRASLAVDKGVEASLRVFEQMVVCVGDPLFQALVRDVAPHVATAGRSRTAIAAELTPSEKLGLMAQLFSRGDLPNDLRICFRNALSRLAADIQPEFLLCGQVRPRLLGFDLGPSLVDAGVQVTKVNLTAVQSYSPSYLLAVGLISAGSAVSGGTVGMAAGPLASVLFANDRGTYGVAYAWPDPLEPFLGGLEGRFRDVASVERYLDTGVDAFLANATHTFAYSLSPLGFKTVDTQTRLVLPNFTAHPARPGSTWVRPESRPGLNLPSRLELVTAALTNHLPGSSLGLIADPKWKGTSADLGAAFGKDASARAKVAGLSFADDYFPHGGVLGGAYVQIPRALYEAPAPELGVALAPTNDVLTRLVAAATWVQDYVLQSRQAGALGFYLPAPNPPVFTDAQGRALNARSLLDGILSRDPDSFGTPGVLATSEFFLKGWLDGQLLGVPLARASLEVALGDDRTGNGAFFRATGQVPSGSWLDAFSPGARVELDLRKAPTRPLEEAYREELVLLNQAIAAGSAAERQRVLERWLGGLTSGLPRVKLEMELPLQMPAGLSEVVRFNGGTWLYAYSPRFEPGFEPANLSPRARARREGGLAFRGNLDLRANNTTLLSIPNAELSVLPRSGGFPALAGSFQASSMTYGALALRQASVQFASEPTPGFQALGVLDPIRFNVFTLESPTGGSLTGRLEVARASAGGTQARLRLSPAQLRLLTTTLRLHGAQAADPFEFSTDGPWTAAAEPTSLARYGVGNTTILQMETAAFAGPLTVSGQGTSQVEVRGELQPGAILTLFPGRSYEQRVPLTSSRRTAFVARQDGTFLLESTVGSQVNLGVFPGLSIASVQSGSTVRVSQEGVVYEGQLAGRLLETAGGAGFTTAGRVVLSRDGLPTVTANTTFALGPWIDRTFRIEGPAGGALSATLGTSELLVSGGRFVIDQVLTQSFSAFPMPASGNVAFSFGPAGLSLGGTPLAQVQYRVSRTNGVLRVDDFRASASIPGLSASLDLRGRLSSEGTLVLSNSATGLTLAGLGTTGFEWSLRREPESWISTVAASAPRAWWSFNETKSLTASNRVSPKLDGTYTGAVVQGEPAAVAYPGNRSVDFLGKGSVVVGTQPEFNAMNTALSIEAWIRVDAFTRTWSTIASRGDNSWRLQRDNTGRALRFDTDGLNPPYLSGARAVDDGRWHHVVATYDGRAKAIYIDGTLDAWTAATGVIASSTHPVVLGENAQSTGRLWDGELDELALYSRALTPAEVLAHARAGGAWGTQARLRLTAEGLGGVSLSGSLAPQGSFDLAAESTSTLTPGGYPLQNGTLRVLRLSPAAPSVLLSGSLAVPGLPAVDLAGQYSVASGFDLQGTASSADFGGVGLDGLTLRLRTSGGQTSLGASGQLNVPVLGSLALQGSLQTDGAFELTNNGLPGNSLFGFPTASWNATLRRSPAAYATMIAGEPKVTTDYGASPLAYWRLGETTGSTATDAKKAALGRPDYPATYTGGVRLGDPGALTGSANGDRAVFLDGVDDVIGVGQEAPFDLTRTLSIEAWIRVASWTKAWQAVVTKGDNAWRLSRFNTTGRISFETTSGGTHHSLEGGPDLNDNRWHHVVATYDGQAKALYIDGALEAYALYDKELDRNDWPVQLGGNAQVAGRTFHGGLDEVAIYDRALSPEEIARHYLAGGGTAMPVAARLAIPGVQGIDLQGLLHPRGAVSLQAGFPSLAAGAFTLRDGRFTAARTPSGTRLAVLNGGVSSDFGALAFSGTTEPNGAFTLFTRPTGTLNVGPYAFSYSAPVKLTPTQWEGAGTVAFGRFGLSGTLKVPGSGVPAFTGTATGTSSPKAFGKTISGAPGHPYAWVSWTVTGTYEPANKTLKTTVAGSLTVEYETTPGKYAKKNFEYGPVNIGTSGALTVNPGESFSGISSFGFTLP